MFELALSSFLVAQSVGPGFVGRPIQPTFRVCLNDTRPSSYVNLRTSPSTNSRSKARLNHGAPIYFYRTLAGNDGFYWAQVSTNQGDGYVRDDYVCVN